MKNTISSGAGLKQRRWKFFQNFSAVVVPTTAYGLYAREWNLIKRFWWSQRRSIHLSWTFRPAFGSEMKKFHIEIKQNQCRLEIKSESKSIVHVTRNPNTKTPCHRILYEYRYPSVSERREVIDISTKVSRTEKKTSFSTFSEHNNLFTDETAAINHYRYDNTAREEESVWCTKGEQQYYYCRFPSHLKTEAIGSRTVVKLRNPK